MKSWGYNNYMITYLINLEFDYIILIYINK